MTERARDWKSSAVIRECVKERGSNIQSWPKGDRELVEYAIQQGKPETEAALSEGWEALAQYFEAMGK